MGSEMCIRDRGETGGGPEGHGATVGKAGRGGEGELLVADSAVAVGGDLCVKEGNT